MVLSWLKCVGRALRKRPTRIILTVVLMVLLHFLPVTGWLRFGLYLIPYLLISFDILKKAAYGVAHRQVFDENFLMTVATIGAIAVALTDNGDYLEAVGVMLFYQIGEWFQSYAVGKSRKSIGELMDIRPDYANVQRGGDLVQVDPDEVAPGSVIVVQPGEKIPIDGVVVTGAASLNMSALTGESLPRDVQEGDAVFSGSINLTGVLNIRTTKAFGESTASKILDLVENASARKSRSENFIAQFARIYTPVVCFCALALAFFPPLIRMLFLDLPAAWSVWIYRALTFLVVSCPCALVISIPLSFFAGLGGASRAGILIKGSNYLEALAKTDCVVFDKTGTLTQGAFEVDGIHHSPMDDAQLVEYAALAESASSHPISKSLQRAYGRALDRTRVRNVQEISGCGLIADVDGRTVAIGNVKLMDRLHVPYLACHQVGTILHVAIDGTYAGHIVIADVVKPEAKQAMAALRAAGVKKTVMLTGDAKAVADQVAADLEMDAVYSELLPGDKVDQVEKLLRVQRSKGRLAFVGDGMNDAPALSRADIGIAMGAMGSDAAIEAADVVLMDDNPMLIAKAIRISRKCIRIVYQNAAFSIGVKVGCLVLTAFGVANMWLAVFADVGVMILAVLNAIRALFVKKG